MLLFCLKLGQHAKICQTDLTIATETCPPFVDTLAEGPQGKIW